ncbi:SAM-dependent methyltransferase [Pseudoalteromonas fuliginea]|uniref:Class I SAM-dependent methyltransferase n=1 Tax=Pseudoalteromonas fuliginea TaxID=1872678 RepID=A0ABQ6RID2_9GAMM|nr:class I SAM-dependent methyltransferase [Pseudoalteromonas fuliginea]KAA1156632.1 class I SAM-dependent methyltransferase [Pseudoalteromonas fuliginea]KAA1167461.1 class I SAM-dependent methyltransferase [Pseudoalteromonas fuliginea]
MDTELLNRYRNAVTHLLNEPADAGLMKPFINDLKNYLGNITSISTDFDMNDWNDENTSQGVAISPVQAAKCIEETLRTQIFMQGIKLAIEERLKATTDDIHILYAGTGPYGTLLIPYLSLATNSRIKVTLIDIHPENISAIKKLVKHFSITQNIVAITCDDATRWQAPDSQQFDIIISETMTALLKREPQVFIFAHLCQFLHNSGTLIPQNISLKAWLTPFKSLMSIEGSTTDDILLKEFYCLNIDEARRLNAGDASSFKGNMLIPNGVDTNYRLKLTTDIQVYKHHRLTENQCSLNIPLTFLPHDAQLRGGEAIHYEYITPKSADFIFTFPIKNTVKTEADLALFSDLTRLGLPGVKRMFERAQAAKSDHPFSIADDEWALWTELLDTLTLPYHETTVALYQSQSIEEFEHWLVTNSNLKSL